MPAPSGAPKGCGPAAGLECAVDLRAFVILTLGITCWAAQRTRTAEDFSAGGGGDQGSSSV